MDKACEKCGVIPKEVILLRCSRCKEVRYCSKDCQVKHWKMHKLICRPKMEGANKKDHTKKDASAMTTVDQRKKRDAFENAYLAEHCGNAPLISSFSDKQLSTIFLGFTPLSNYSKDFFQDEISDGLRSIAMRSEIENEYKLMRLTPFSHYAGYESGEIIKRNRKPQSLTLLRRLGARSIFLHKTDWYFARPVLGTVYNDQVIPPYNTFTTASFSNFINPSTEYLTYGTTHVAVGFVDLGILLNCQYKSNSSNDPLRVYGYESSAYAIAKALLILDLLKNGDPEEAPRQIVQVWYSTVWTKRTTKAFLAAAKKVINKPDLHPDVAAIICHWSNSKGVGLKRATKLRSHTKKESSNARYFLNKCDRNEMIRYHLTGEVGLCGGIPCSGSITMWDCPEGTPPLQQNACLFNTMSIQDVLESNNWNGNYFRTAENEKVERVQRLMAHIQNNHIEVHLRHGAVGLGTAVADEISKLNPDSISWSNVLDYFLPLHFHELAKVCSAKQKCTRHSGYSMNWPFSTFGSSIIDFETSAECLDIIEKSNIEFRQQVHAYSNGSNMFSSPIRKNPENTSMHFLSVETYLPWVDYFFKSSKAASHQEQLEEYNPLSISGSVVSLVWTYT